MAGYLSKVADFDPPHLHLSPPLGVTPVEFRGDLWLQKTRVPVLSCGVVCVIARLAVLVEHRLVTDGRTDTGSSLVYCRFMASRGKNMRCSILHRESKKDTKLLAITPLCIIRFSKFFHYPTRQEICNKFVFKYSTTL